MKENLKRRWKKIIMKRELKENNEKVARIKHVEIEEKYRTARQVRRKW